MSVCTFSVVTGIIEFLIDYSTQQLHLPQRWSLYGFSVTLTGYCILHINNCYSLGIIVRKSATLTKFLINYSIKKTFTLLFAEVFS